MDTNWLNIGDFIVLMGSAKFPSMVEISKQKVFVESKLHVEVQFSLTNKLEYFYMWLSGNSCIIKMNQFVHEQM